MLSAEGRTAPPRLTPPQACSARSLPGYGRPSLTTKPCSARAAAILRNDNRAGGRWCVRGEPRLTQPHVAHRGSPLLHGRVGHVGPCCVVPRHGRSLPALDRMRPIDAPRPASSRFIAMSRGRAHGQPRWRLGHHADDLGRMDRPMLMPSAAPTRALRNSAQYVAMPAIAGLASFP